MTSPVGLDAGATAEADSLFAMLLTIAALSMAFATMLLAHAVLRVHAVLWLRPAGMPLATIALLAVLAGTFALELRSASLELRLAFTALAYAVAVVAQMLVARQLRLDLAIAASSALALTILNAVYAAMAVIVVVATRVVALPTARTNRLQRTVMYARFLAAVTAVTYLVVWLS